ncbi:hypothetical protein MRX96_054673 [Rhipicephalus microplus]
MLRVLFTKKQTLHPRQDGSIAPDREAAPAVPTHAILHPSTLRPFSHILLCSLLFRFPLSKKRRGKRCATDEFGDFIGGLRTQRIRVRQRSPTPRFAHSMDKRRRASPMSAHVVQTLLAVQCQFAGSRRCVLWRT